MSQLPSGWAKVELGECLQSVVGGGTPSRDVPAYFAGSIPWFTVKDLKVLKPSDAEEHISEDAVTNSATKVVPPNTLICATRIALGRAMRPTVRCAINQDLKALFPEEGINSDFLLYWIIANERMIQDKGSGTTVSGIRLEILKSLPLNLPPSTEQTRIVDKLEELLSDLDAGVAELNTAQRKLAQYRQSLLKAAVEGALTADWRAARGEPEETGAELLQRILAERRARWEQKQLAKFAEQGKTPPKDWQAKYPEPSAPDLTGLPSLPEGWVWATAEQLCEFITKGTTPPKSMDDGSAKPVPFLRVTNLTDTGALNFTDKVFVSRGVHEGFLARSIVYPNDVLMNIVGPPLGQVSIVTSDFDEWNINQAIAIFRAVSGVAPAFVATYLLSNTALLWLKRRAKTTAGQTNLTLEVCRELPVPLPTVKEQKAIAERIDAQLVSLAAQLDAIGHCLKQAAAQRKNLLKAAFAGQLVPQDSNDEPARELLAYIRAKRASNAGSAPRRRRKTA